MRRLSVVVLLALAVAACDSTPPSPKSAQVQSINTVMPVPAQLDPPPMLNDEAPPPKPKALPWETPTPIVFSPEDEKLRASLPFSPAIAMDPIDGSKISIRAATPTFEYKGKIYYFSSEGNKQAFSANPEQYLKGGYMRL
ncbi:MAG: YHS domain-containing protein [Thermoanaerobaculia bacterium]